MADEQVPLADFDRAWEGAAARIHELLDAGKRVAIHCKGGSGRTGLIAARILIDREVPRATAIARVRRFDPGYPASGACRLDRTLRRMTGLSC